MADALSVGMKFSVRIAKIANCTGPPFLGAHEVHRCPLIAVSELTTTFIHISHPCSAAFVCPDSRPRLNRIQAAVTMAPPATIAEWLTRPGLLRRPTAADNAAMENEPKRKRRWLQFRLRTLLIGVTLNGHRSGGPAGLVVRSQSPGRPREALYRDERLSSCCPALAAASFL
jgi:hypothetical protein